MNAFLGLNPSSKQSELVRHRIQKLISSGHSPFREKLMINSHNQTMPASTSNLAQKTCSKETAQMSSSGDSKDSKSPQKDTKTQ